MRLSCFYNEDIIQGAIFAPVTVILQASKVMIPPFCQNNSLTQKVKKSGQKCHFLEWHTILLNPCWNRNVKVMFWNFIFFCENILKHAFRFEITWHILIFLNKYQQKVETRVNKHFFLFKSHISKIQENYLCGFFCVAFFFLFSYSFLNNFTRVVSFFWMFIKKCSQKILKYVYLSISFVLVTWSLVLGIFKSACV